MNNWPSTTQVLKDLGLYGEIARWSDRAAENRDESDACTNPAQRGRVVDGVCNLLLMRKGIPTEWRAKHETCCVPFVEGYEAFLRRHDVTLIKCGFEVVDKIERTHGHPDQLVMLDGVRALLDIKTGGMSPVTAIQLASYEVGIYSMGEKERVTRFGLQLTRGDFRLHPFTDPRDKDEWRILVRAWHVQRKYQVLE